jgi:hypothetical protein
MKRHYFSIGSGNSTAEPTATDNPSKVQPIEGGRDWAKSRHPERRCTARRSDGSGEQCRNASLRGQRVCRYHGGAARQSKAAARRRIDEHADPLVRAMIEIAQADDVSPATRVAAIKDLLDRADITGKTSIEVEHTVKPWEQILGRMAGVATGMSRAECRRCRPVRRCRLSTPRLSTTPHVGRMTPQTNETTAGGHRPGPTARHRLQGRTASRSHPQ